MTTRNQKPNSKPRNITEDWYYFEHYHSGIAHLPPAAEHDGTADQIIEKRKQTRNRLLKNILKDST